MANVRVKFTHSTAVTQGRPSARYSTRRHVFFGKYQSHMLELLKKADTSRFDTTAAVSEQDTTKHPHWQGVLFKQWSRTSICSSSWTRDPRPVAGDGLACPFRQATDLTVVRNLIRRFIESRGSCGHIQQYGKKRPRQVAPSDLPVLSSGSPWWYQRSGRMSCCELR